MKKYGFKEGGPQKTPSNFAMTFLTFQKFKFSRGSMPPDPLLSYAPKGNSVPLKRKKA